MRLPGPHFAATALVAVLVATAGTELVIVAGHGASRRPAAAPPATRQPSTTPSTARAPTVATSATPSPPPTPSRTASPTHAAEPTPHRTPVPRLAANTLAIPRQHVVAPIDVCRIVDGGLEPPADVHRTCRWAGGAGLGTTAGTTVITGHINWVGQGTGALGRLDQLRPGDVVYTTDQHGALTAWRVQGLVRRPKTQGIYRAAFAGRTGPRQLYLVSCDGAFDPATASYANNVYLLATPADDAPASARSQMPTGVPAGGR